MKAPESGHSTPPIPAFREERLLSLARTNWLGQGLDDGAKAKVDEIRQQYRTTARDYLLQAQILYDQLRAEDTNAPLRATSSRVSRGSQLFVAYLILWEAFAHLYNAAAYTRFSHEGVDRSATETARERIAAVLGEPYLGEDDFLSIKLLKNDETVNGCLSRILSRTTRETGAVYGIEPQIGLTDMDAFLQGVVRVPTSAAGEAAERDAWTLQALDDRGQPCWPEEKSVAIKYRAVLTWHAYQLRHNLNFSGKSADSIDDALLIIRAYCLLEPIVSLLLQESRKALIFAL